MADSLPLDAITIRSKKNIYTLDRDGRLCEIKLSKGPRVYQCTALEILERISERSEATTEIISTTPVGEFHQLQLGLCNQAPIII